MMIASVSIFSLKKKGDETDVHDGDVIVKIVIVQTIIDFLIGVVEVNFMLLASFSFYFHDFLSVYEGTDPEYLRQNLMVVVKVLMHKGMLPLFSPCKWVCWGREWLVVRSVIV